MTCLTGLEIFRDVTGSVRVPALAADPDAPVLSVESLSFGNAGHRIEVFDLTRALLAWRAFLGMTREEVREFGTRVGRGRRTGTPEQSEIPRVAALETALRAERRTRLAAEPPWYARTTRSDETMSPATRVAWIRKQLSTPGRVESWDERARLAQEWTTLAPEDPEAWAVLSMSVATVRHNSRRPELSQQVLDAAETALRLGVADGWRPVLAAWVGEVLYAFQRHDEAIPQLLEARRGAQPGGQGLLWHESMLVDCFSRLGRHEEAAEAARIGGALLGISDADRLSMSQAASLQGLLARLQSVSPRVPALVISGVRSGSTAEKAGFLAGDVVLEVDGRDYVIPSALYEAFGQMARPPEGAAERPQRVRVWRSEGERDLDVSAGVEGLDLGTLLGKVATAAAFQTVQAGSLAARSGLQLHDVVLRVGANEPRSVGDFLRAWKAVPAGEAVTFVVLRSKVGAGGLPRPVSTGTEDDAFSQWAYTRHDIRVVKDSELLGVVPMLYTTTSHRGLKIR